MHERFFDQTFKRTVHLARFDLDRRHLASRCRFNNHTPLPHLAWLWRVVLVCSSLIRSNKDCLNFCRQNFEGNKMKRLNFKKLGGATIAFLFINGQAYATVCNGDASAGWSMASPGTNLTSTVNGAGYTPKGPATATLVGDLLGINIQHNAENDAVMASGLAYKMNDIQDTNARTKAWRFPGGSVSDHYTVKSDGTTAYVVSGDYNSTTAALTRTDVMSPTNLGYTDYKEFLAKAKLAGATKLFFVANVQEAFARCMPSMPLNTPDVATTTCTSTNTSRGYPGTTNMYANLGAAVGDFATRAKDWATLINTEIGNVWGASAKPKVYWELGNEVYIPGSYGVHTLTWAEMDLVLSKYSGTADAPAGIRTASASNIDSSYWSIGVTGPVGLNGLAYTSWWQSLHNTPYYWDFGVVHGNYSMNSLINPFFAADVNCNTAPVATVGGANSAHPMWGKKDVNTGTINCRNSQYRQPDTGGTISSFVASLGKAIAITEWGAADTSDAGWLDQTNFPISQTDSMINFASTIGDFYSAGDNKVIAAILWPTTGNLGGDYRSMLTGAYPWSSTYNQFIASDLRDALAGQWWGDTNGGLYKEAGTGVEIWTTNNTTDHRYVVVVNNSTNVVKLPITVSTLNSGNVWVTGRRSAFPNTRFSCDFPKNSSANYIKIDAKSVAILNYYK